MTPFAKAAVLLMATLAMRLPLNAQGVDFIALKYKAEKGNAVAQSNLGLAYARGSGVPKDAVEAVKWYSKAAAQGYAEAQFALGESYVNGEGVEKDAVEGYAYLNLSGITLEKARVARSELEAWMTKDQVAEGQRKSKEIKERLRQEAEEKERLRKEAEEKERLRHEEEKKERLRKDAEEKERLRYEAEEKERLRYEAEEKERLRKEAEEKERLRKETERKERLRKEAEEKERLRYEAEEKERLPKEAEEKERLRKEAEEMQKEKSLQQLISVSEGTLPSDSSLAGQAVSTFEIWKYEVTWVEWKEVRDWAVTNNKGYDLAGVGGTYSSESGDQVPVVNVNWYDVVKWCNAKSEQEGKTPVYTVNGAIYKTGEVVPKVNVRTNGYRLPSEKEWEWAARGGASGVSHIYTYSGSNDSNDVAWTSENSSGATKEVGAKRPNELGIYDMSGNVWEWCSNMSGAAYCRIRGGSWYYKASYAAVAIRDHSVHPNCRINDLGFRLARSSGKSEPRSVINY